MLSKSASRPGFALPMLLLRAFQEIVDELHSRLAADGFDDARPLHGFVLQAVGPDGTSAVELGRRLGVSKQAAGKTVAGLEEQGYLERATDQLDTRRKVVRLTARGHALLERSAEVLDALRANWVAELGEQRVREMEDGLAGMSTGPLLRWETPGWFTRV